MSAAPEVMEAFVPLGASTRSALTTQNLHRTVEDAYSSRDLVISDCSSSEDEDGDSYTDEANLSPEKNTPSFPQRLLSMGDQDDASLVEAEAIAGIEDRVIAKNLRLFVFAIFLVLCIGLPLIVYKTSSRKQVESFEGAFNSLSDKMFMSVQTKLDQQLSAANSLAIALTSHAAASVGANWPFVTIPDWDLRANNVKDLGDFLSVSLSPVVTQQQRFLWQVYTQENLDWLWQAQSRNETSGVSRQLEQGGSLPSIDTIVQSTLDNQLQSMDDMWSIHNGQHISKDIFRPDPSGLGFAPEAPENSPFLPLWLQMPPVSTMINLNILSLDSTGSAAAGTMTTETPTMSQVVDLEDAGPSQRELLTEYYTLLLQDYHGDPNAHYEGDPVASMSFPVFDTFDMTQKNVVAALTSVIQFQQYFDNVLPEDNGGLLVVVSNTCGDVFSYEVTGESAIFLGNDDYHNPAFDYLEKSCDLLSKAASDFDLSALDEKLCQYTITLYPDESLHQHYITNDPVMYAVVIAVVILFVSLVSLAYDLIVQRRMKRIIDAARSNKALLTSLYPDNVRERLVKEEQERNLRSPRRNSNDTIGFISRRSSGDNTTQAPTTESPGRKREVFGGRRRHSGDSRRRNSGEHLISDIFHSSVSGAVTGVSTAVSGVSTGVSTVVTGVGTMAGFLVTPLAPSKLRLRFLLNEEDNQKNPNDTVSTQKSEESCPPNEKPIADLFPHCTVLFADISGFTAWSSERQPEQVFTLLQEIFQAFDRLAKRRDVFKVETIGDCYVRSMNVWVPLTFSSYPPQLTFCTL